LLPTIGSAINSYNILSPFAYEDVILKQLMRKSHLLSTLTFMSQINGEGESCPAKGKNAVRRRKANKHRQLRANSKKSALLRLWRYLISLYVTPERKDEKRESATLP
jgi:hypothetical protein